MNESTPQPPMAFIEQLAADLAAQGMTRNDMIHHIYDCNPYVTLAQLQIAVDTAIEDAGK